MELLDHPVLEAMMGLPEMLELLEEMELLEHQVRSLDLLVLLGHLELLVPLEVQDLRDWMVLLELVVTTEPPDLLDLLEHLAKLEHQVKMEHLDQPELLDQPVETEHQD